LHNRPVNRRRFALCGIALLTGAACQQTTPPPPQVPAPAPAPITRHALIISIDGLRPDLLTVANTPRIHALMKSGSYTLWARTVEEGYTLSSHVSMLTGVTPSRHGVTWNSHLEDAYPNVPTIFEIAKKSGLTTAVIAGKTKFVVLTRPGTLDWSSIGNEDVDRDLDVARRAVAIVRDHRPDLTFVHFAQVDMIGHARGWGSPDQIQALAQADEAVGVVQDAIAAAGLAEATLILLTADHGGAGYSHEPEDIRSQLIPWIVSGPSVRRNLDLTTIPDLAVTTMATFATVCAFLELKPDGPIDGLPVMQIFEPADR